MATTSGEHHLYNSWAHQLNTLLAQHVSPITSSSTSRPTTRGRDEALRQISKKKKKMKNRTTTRKSSPPPSSSSSFTPSSSSGRSSPEDETSTTKKLYRQHHACTQCGTRYTSQWRMGPSGSSTLCNACGIRYARELKHRVLPVPCPEIHLGHPHSSSVRNPEPSTHVVVGSPRVSSIYALLN